ncbi:prepilin-type N-terminal cleavage/methylation domain-containing protein [Pullulanibacillus sp. KACC 23026]|uniref:prepilin-type N-terminal cleavage/methylation domain-containing protein n=1 Tax=Pullulanibacillus sp. KACC 23026 TaxID=3028315 RepID=UPI0023AFCCF0|nr:prepilin-type N-terminal cleavage/methylation domain-containing protein [Pullulanibacillus sp. KACC 23026]WEG11461.1 prepilin-type N-terminal cleavage/methylation domain-containing protein [Pullulanibacillus sp. KACC 23026]
MIKKLLKKQDGFTLVELLAVIVILAIIAAISIPAIGHIINNSRNKASVNDALQIIDAAKLYVADHPNYTPSDTPDTDSEIVGTTGDTNSLATYLNSTVSGSTFEYVYEDTSGAYHIVGHKVNGKTDPVTTAANDATEAQLIKYINDGTLPSGS